MTWQNRGKTPAIDVKSVEWDTVDRSPKGKYLASFTSVKRHVGYGTVWREGSFMSSTMSPSIVSGIPEGRLRLYELVEYRDLNRTLYHVRLCFDVVKTPLAAVGECPESPVDVN